MFNAIHLNSIGYVFEFGRLRMMFIHEETGYDLWSDPAYDYLDYEELLTEEYKDLGYNPRNVKAVGKEIELD